MIFFDELGKLANPYVEVPHIQPEPFSKEDLISFFKEMLDIRLVEELIADLVEKGLAKCPCHLSIGQEAVPVGISKFLRKTDRVFGAHRSHGHYLALGGSSYKLLAEVLGKKTGCSKGMGGSMHIVDRENGFAGSVPIVAGTVPLAVGAALAAKMEGKQDIGVAYFGDGACEEGIIHESLNASVVMDLPILFVVENNLFSSHLDIHLRQPSNRVSRFAEAHKMNYVLIDGNDVCEVARVAKKMIDTCRQNNTPAFIEAVTYRLLGHVGADPNIDVGLKRKPEDIRAWKKRDPISRLRSTLIQNYGLETAFFDDIEGTRRTLLQKELEQAMQDPYPPLSFLDKFLYT